MQVLSELASVNLFLRVKHEQHKVFHEAIKSGVFFRCRTQNSRRKKLKLKEFSRKTQAIFSKNSKNRKFLENYITNLTYYQNLTLFFSLSLFDPVLRLKKLPETEFLLQKLKKYSETQGNFPKTQAKFFKNSIYRKVHSPALPPKRRKKTLQQHCV